eukprot:4240791-Karenia_brevis.AAC.1
MTTLREEPEPSPAGRKDGSATAATMRSHLSLLLRRATNLHARHAAHGWDGYTMRQRALVSGGVADAMESHLWLRCGARR